MRVIAVDAGGKRTGLALCVGEAGEATDLPPGMPTPSPSSGSGMASPLGMLQTSSERVLLQGVAQYVKSEQPDALLLGLPLNMDGTEGPSAQKARRLAGKLADEVELPVLLVDERRTSLQADAFMARSGLTHKQKKARRDALAAVAIAEVWLTQGPIGEAVTPSSPC